MAAPISVQQLKDASEDAITLSDFINKPENVMIPRRLATDINSLQYYLEYMKSYAQKSYETYSEMLANASNLSENVSVFVTNDLDTANNGIYTYNGTSFVKGEYQPENAAKEFVEAKLGGLEVFNGKVRAQDVSTVDGSTQDAKNTEFRNDLDALPFEGGVLADTFVTATTNNGTIPRTQREINSERVSIKSYGAIGDGTLHTVAEWTVIGSRIYYVSLEAIQVDYPHVTSLTDSIDWAATQKAVTNNVAVHCPKGKYVLSNSVKTPHYTNSRAVGFAGLDITGDGGQTLFTRNDKSECTRIYHSTTKFTTQESDTANQNEACFAVHSPHTRISNMTIIDSKLGVYYGQDFAQPFTSLSSVTYSSLNNVGIRGCGTGVLFLATGGNHYVDFHNVFFFANQIDTHKRAGFWWGVTKGRGDNNNNRHNYYKVRSDSSRVGYWNECGDTTTTISWHGENCSSTTGQNSYPVPHGLPTDMLNAAGELKQSSVFIEGEACQYNQYYGCMTESCEHHLYNGGYKNSYETCLIDASKSTFIREPHIWSMRTGLSMTGIKYFADTPATNIDKVHKVQGRLYLGDGMANGVSIVSNTYRHAPTDNLNNSEAIKYQIEFGAVVKETELIITLWEDSVPDINKIGNFNLDVVSRCITAGQNSCFSAKGTVSAMRSNTRTFTHYSMHVAHSFRSWFDRHLVNVYEMVGEPPVKTETTSQAMRLSVRPDPSNSRNLHLVITCPWDLSGGTIFIEKQTQRLNS